MLNAKFKTTERLILDALFADDCALMAHSESDLQVVADIFVEAAHFFGLTIVLAKPRSYSSLLLAPEHLYLQNH